MFLPRAAGDEGRPDGRAEIRVADWQAQAIYSLAVRWFKDGLILLTSTAKRTDRASQKRPLPTPARVSKVERLASRENGHPQGVAVNLDLLIPAAGFEPATFGSGAPLLTALSLPI